MHLIYKRLFLLFVASALSLLSYAQNGQNRITNPNNVPKFEILQENRSIGEAEQMLQQKLNLAPEAKFFPTKQFTDKIGFKHTKYQQTYKGVDVVFGTYKVHSKNGQIKSFNGEFFQVKDLDVSPTLSKDAAFEKALQHVGASQYMWNSPSASIMNYVKPDGELVILPKLLEGNTKSQSLAKLAFRFDIYASQPVSRAMIYIDAKTGAFLYQDNIIHHISHCESPTNGTAATRYSGNQTIQTDSYNGSHRLREYTRGNGIETYDMNTGTNYNNAVDFTDSDNNWTAGEHDNTAKDNAALDAHWGAAMTYDYWMNKHSRNSFDGNGAKIKSYVHYDVAYDNAYWNGSVMTYGDGSDTYFDALTSLDVAAHEIGHAVMSHTADLTYSYESGAMNEGFSDIWGASVEYFAAPTKQTWLIGEDIERRAGHAALRSMSDPKSEGQPDTYQGTNWATGSSDNGGVHTNSGVLNYWYYLVSIGGTGTNDNGDAYSVTGIGIDDAAKIAYRMISVYLSSSSQYADARTFGIQSAVDLFGAGSAAEIAVTNAWQAVGIGAAYGSTNYCSSKGNSINDEYIGRVQLNTIDNTSGATSGYTNHTSISTDLTLGSNYTITVTPHWTGTIYDEGYAVWIDYNNDGDFSDSGELIWSKAASKDTPVSGSFTVPSGTTAGSTRMRVSMKYNGVPTACESFSYGEVEDYTVNLVGSTVDTQAPSDPTNLSSSNITQTTVDLSWTASTDNVGVTGYDIFRDGTNMGTVTGNSAQITGLSASTSYNFYVTAHDAAGNISGNSNTINITTLTPPDTQAPSDPTNLTASNTTQTTVDLSWTGSTDNVGVTGYDIYQGSSNIGSTTGTSAQITGLSASTNYSFHVTAHDAAGNESGSSNTVSVTTQSPPSSGCTAQVATFPYGESFENTLGLWTQDSGDDFNWTIRSGGTPSSGTGPSSATDGTYYIYMESSSPNYSSKRAILNGPCLDLTNETSATATFKYHMLGASNMGSLDLEASTNNGTTWSSIWSKSGNQGSSWLDASIDLGSYIGSTVKLRFNGITGTTWKGDMAVDAFEVSNGSSGGGCVATTLTITFDNYPEETSWEIKDGSTVLFSGGTYGSQADGSTLVIPNCIDPGCYDFTMKDTYGDGMCCGYGNGSYTFTRDSDGAVLASGGSFNSTDVTNFCLSAGSFAPTNSTKVAYKALPDVSIFPNPTDGSFNVRLRDKRMESYRIFDMMGQLVAKGHLSEAQIDVSKLSTGIYSIEFLSDKKSMVSRLVKH